MKINKFFIFIFFLFLLFFMFPILFSQNPLSGGDYNTPTKNFIDIVSQPVSWCEYINLGYNCSAINLRFIPVWIVVGQVSQFFHLQAYLTERLLLWLPFFLIGFFSWVFLIKQTFPGNKLWFLGPIIYLANTYIYLIVTGGQIAGVGLAYAIAPLALATFIQTCKNPAIKSSLLFAFVLAFAILLDQRFAYIDVSALGLYFFFELCTIRKNRNDIIRLLYFAIVLPALIVFALQMYWILPSLLVHENPLDRFGSAYTSIGAVAFFSFAKFENTLSLLHPNWPENIFGLTHFMRPEFLVLPILAFSSLLFINRHQETNNKKFIAYFSLLGLIGAFLAKGSNDPFGGLYVWFFEHVPGFVVFRDSTKWYTLVALSYSVLIVFSTSQLYETIKRSKKFSNTNRWFNFQNIFVFLVVYYVLFLIRSAFFGQNNGVLKVNTIPQEYIKLETFLSSQPQFSRVLWIPIEQHFSYYSIVHPGLQAYDFFRTSDTKTSLKALQKPHVENILMEASVKYVVIPFDSQRDIFITDRKYNELLYANTVKEVQKIPWLKEIPGFGKLHVFALPSFQQHFWLLSKGQVTFLMINPTKYIVTLTNIKKGDMLVFSDGYDSHWTAQIVGNKWQEIYTKPFNNLLNSFVLPKSGTYQVVVTFQPQQWVTIGIWISGLSLIITILIFLFLLVR